MNENGDPLPAEWRPYRSNHRVRSYSVAGEIFDVALALPTETSDERPSALLIVLDGALHFEAAAAAAAALARRSEKTGVGPTVVAGIASGHGWTHDAARREGMLVPGEALHGALRDLITARLLPDLRDAWNVDARRQGIFGHSFGALFALDLASTAPSTFVALAASPSLWRKPELAGTLFPSGAPGQRLLLASGALEPERILGPVSELAERLRRQGHELECVVMENEDHGSVPFVLLPHALRFLHAGRRLSDSVAQS